jgi:predicted TIM-barrel fold metal-dependent hydrolase
MTTLMRSVAELPLLDHHCHGVFGRDLDRAAFEANLTEAAAAHPGAGSLFDTQVGFAVRRFCAPVLDLAAHATPEDYLARRAELGHAEVTARFLGAARLGGLCVDTGFTPEALLPPAALGVAAHAPAYEIVRLEQVAEEVAATGVGAGDFANAVRERLAVRTRDAVGVKSIAAYRVGLGLAPDRPDDRTVREAAARFLATSPRRLADEVLHRFLVYCAVDLDLPVQFHCGYGDADVRLHECNPLLLTDLLRALQPAGVPVVLLHNYPYHREAGYLAQVFPHVYLDVSLATHNLGRRSVALLAEALELAPFAKLLYASDAYGLPELYHLGAVLFRHALSDLLSAGVAEDAWRPGDADRMAALVGADNAKRVYRLP